ncbi:piggyBac transposable element-derived protein 4-like [Stegodyphus dumicola]|uniref:piggyBac transposable element-derived protein 4-like n=1 Tax=Stegodyphus dumicola TaxID=202533 RepID=UPI0015A937F7|nr:piggyBac transposable element-derived protein 4-like [Stegodyphus dumicola]
MKVYLGKDKDERFEGRSASESVVLHLAKHVKGKGHSLFMDNFFSTLRLFLELRNNYKINCCGTVQIRQKDLPKDLTARKAGDLDMKYSNGLTVACWKDKREVYVLSSMHERDSELLPVMNNCERTSKPALIHDYNKNMGYVDLSDRMANSYGFSRKSQKWTKKLFSIS